MDTGNPRLTQLVERLRAGGFRGLAGATLSASIPIAEPLLNEIVAAVLPAGGPVREASLHPQADNRLGVRVRLARPEFLPPINLTLAIDRQPELPHDPRLRFRMTGLPGLLSFAGSMVSMSSLFPPGVRVDGDLVIVDLAAVLAQRGQGDLLAHARRLRVSTAPGRLEVDVELAVAGT